MLPSSLNVVLSTVIHHDVLTARVSLHDNRFVRLLKGIRWPNVLKSFNDWLVADLESASPASEGAPVPPRPSCIALR